VINALLFCVAVVWGQLLVTEPAFLGPAYHARDLHLNAAVFTLPFYRTVFPLLLQMVVVALPALWVMRRSSAVRRPLVRALAWIAAVACLARIASAADQPFVRAVLRPQADRKPAPQVVIKDSDGKAVNLKKYRGKVVVLDFWATWCTGCKQEIPWFVEFQKNYGRKGLAVVGVAMDEEGWKIVKPFLAEHHIPYPIATGDDATAKGFGIETLPDTFLIDRHGRIAAAYLAGLVDRENIEANINALLADKR